MKRIYQISIIAVFFTFFVACDNQPDVKTKDNDTKKRDLSACVYSLVNDSVAVNWTAFKTTARIGVGGHFDQIKVWTNDKAESPKDLLAKTSFDIATASVNTGNDERDPKLLTYFFETLTDGHIIKGQIITAEGDDQNGKGKIKIMFNGVTKKVEYTYEIKENKVYLRTGIDLDKWDGANAVKSLNTECNDLHTGKDGVSKLWPDIEIEVIAQFKKDC